MSRCGSFSSTLRSASVSGSAARRRPHGGWSGACGPAPRRRPVRLRRRRRGSWPTLRYGVVCPETGAVSSTVWRYPCRSANSSASLTNWAECADDSASAVLARRRRSSRSERTVAPTSGARLRRPSAAVPGVVYRQSDGARELHFGGGRGAVRPTNRRHCGGPGRDESSLLQLVSLGEKRWNFRPVRSAARAPGREPKASVKFAAGGPEAGAVELGEIVEKRPADSLATEECLRLCGSRHRQSVAPGPAWRTCGSPRRRSTGRRYRGARPPPRRPQPGWPHPEVLPRRRPPG